LSQFETSINLDSTASSINASSYVPEIGNRMINAPAETRLDKPSFREASQRRR